MPAPQSPARISLRDIAQAVGVSHVTVSLALRGDPRISAQRRAEVDAAAKRLGYRPDPMLTSLSAYRQSKRPVTIRSTIIWLNQWANPKSLRNDHLEFAAYWNGAKEVAERLGYRLEELILGKDITSARLQKILATRNVRGLLIPPHQKGLNLPDFDWSPFSIVRFGASVKNPRAHIVTSDQTKCTALAFSTLTKRGFRRIGFISALPFDRNTKGNFRAGFLSSQDAMVPIRQHLHPLFIGERGLAKDMSALRRWLKLARPDAIISTEGELAQLLKGLGLRVPEDITVATTSIADGGFDSGVDQNSTEIGRVAMSTLAGLIQQNERGVPLYCRRILVEGRWVDGTSVPAQKLPS